MEELDVFGLRIFLALGFCLTVFYLLGSFLIGRLKNGYSSVGVKLSLGGLFFISVMAVAHAGIQTGMLFFTVLFVVIGIKNRFRPDFSDLKELGVLRVSIIVICFFALLVEEGYRSDLHVDGAIYVGNSDVSFYSSYGHSMYSSGFETNPENLTPEMRGSVYHFGDLWFSGFFSNYFGVIPYYAYNVLFRVFALGVIMLMVFGWCHQYSKQAWSAFLVAITSVLAVYMELFHLNLPNISLLETFSFVYAPYGLGSHLIVTLAVLPFSLYLLEKNWLLGTCGLLLVPFLNAGLLIVPIIAMLLLGLVFVAQSVFKWGFIELKLSEVLILLAVSAVPLVYYVLGNRLDSGLSNILSIEFIYVFFHTGIRTLLSQVLVIPFVVGLIWYASSQHQVNRKLFVVQLVFYIGTLVGFAFIFPQIQGNSTQILSMHFAGFLAPLGLIGLYAMYYSVQEGMLKWMSAIFMIAIMLQAGRVFIGSEGQRATFDWESYKPGYQETHTVSLEEWKQMYSLLKDDHTVFAYFCCDSVSGASAFYNSFTYLKCLFPGLVFQQLNPIDIDAMSTESRNRHNRTAQGYFALINKGNIEKTEQDMIDFLEPDYILISNNSDEFCIPSRWKYVEKSKNVLKSETYTFYGL